MFYNIEAICELGNPTNTHRGELFQMLDIPKLLFPIFVMQIRIQVRYIVQYDVQQSILTVNQPLHGRVKIIFKRFKKMYFIFWI